MQFGGRFQSQSVKIIFFSVLGVLFFIISNLLTTPYVAGDQEFYRAFYENLETARFSEVAFFQYVNTGSAEPLYGIVMWVGAVNGIDKDVYISIFNTLLCLCIVLFLIKNKASVPFCVLIFSNYYLLVILTSAERLKFSYIFLAIAAVYYSSLKGKLWLLIAPLFHFQSFILIISRSVGLLSVIRIKRKIKYSSLLVFSGLFVVISVLTLLIYKVFIAYLVGKVNAYSDFGGLLGLVNIAILAIISTFIFKKIMKLLFAFLHVPCLL